MAELIARGADGPDRRVQRCGGPHAQGEVMSAPAMPVRVVERDENWLQAGVDNPPLQRAL
jgi:hypothetical protein